MATPLKVPPRPTRDPDIHLKGHGTQKPSRTLKGDVKALAGTVSAARTKWADGRRTADKRKQDVRTEAAKVLAPVKAKIAEGKKRVDGAAGPVYKTIEAVTNGKTRPYVTSFMISSVVSWAIGPQILLAAYERIRFGTSTTDWGLLHGPGRWFRDTVGMAHETGRMGALIWAIILGLTPMIFMGVRNMAACHVAQGAYRGRLSSLAIRWLTRAAYLVPVVYFTGVAYPESVTALFGAPWVLDWWQIYVMGLFCTAYYCTMWALDRIEKGLGLGYFHVILMVPVASIVTGALRYGPDAAW